jgi:splicing factor 3B subunit 3
MQPLSLCVCQYPRGQLRLSCVTCFAACHTAVYGNFSGPKAQEIMVSRGKLLELLRPDDAGKLQTVLSVEVFGQIRSLAAFRLTGASKVRVRPASQRAR